MANKVKEIAGRLVLKHDIESNWNRASSFVPKQGEVIIYDIDSNYSYERFKIGDGTHTVMELPFYLEHEVADAVEKINYLAANMIDASWQDGTLSFTRGIIFPIN